MSKNIYENCPPRTHCDCIAQRFLRQFKDKHIAYIENGETEMLHCWPLEYDLPLVDQPNRIFKILHLISIQVVQCESIDTKFLTYDDPKNRSCFKLQHKRT